MARQFTDEELFRIDPKSYPEKYVDHLIDQYKLYVQSHEKVSERREGSNKFFLSLNSAIIAGVVVLQKYEPDAGIFALVIGVAAVAICIFWYLAIRSYDNLNTGKFKVIHAIERRLPLALYEAEWIALGRGRDAEVYRPISHLERNIPITFGLLHLVLVGIVACN